MKANNKFFPAVALASLLLLGAGCAANTDSQQADSQPTSDAVASADEMAGVEDVVEEGMTPIDGSQVKDGVYDITVDSSSSMFQIVSCELTVENGSMTAQMTMGGTGYLYVYMGTGEQAANADESEYIPFVEDAAGAHTYTVPVEALDAGVPCAAFSKNKEKWYDRTLVFRADSLPTDAFAEGVVTTAEDLSLADGAYQVDVTLEGGSGRASVESPARMTVENGKVTATIVWSSSNYDYMKVDGVRYDAVIENDRSVFTIPVTCFDWKMAVVADTIAMSQPHEIDYALRFDSASISPVAS
nr:hypothetical protein [uncultured Agathobaculum sp.]